MSETMKYAVDCSRCGTVALSDKEYGRQMNRPDALWKCPKCGAPAEWNDDVYEAWAYPESLGVEQDDDSAF